MATSPSTPASRSRPGRRGWHSSRAMRYLLLIALVSCTAAGISALRARGTGAIVNVTAPTAAGTPRLISEGSETPFTATAAGIQLAWVLDQLNGGAATLTEDEVNAHVSPALLAVLPATMLAGALQQFAALGPFKLQGLTRPPTATQATALLTSANGMSFVAPIAVEPDAPARILGMTLVPVSPVEGVDLRPFIPYADPSRFDGLVEVGGRRVYLTCLGSGSPTVVLESGLDDGAAPWTAVAGAVAGFTRVCTYDRPNTRASASDPAPAPRTGRQAAADLDALLSAAGVPAPYVLVGHSIGGHIIRLYAAEHPQSVSGMVLVDAAHEEQDVRRQALVGPELFAQLQAVLSANAEGIDLNATATQVRTARATTPLRPVPLVVLTAGTQDDPALYPEGWPLAAEARLHATLQADLAMLTPSARQVVADKSTHYIHQSEPGLVVDAIHQVVTAARGAR